MKLSGVLITVFLCVIPSVAGDLATTFQQAVDLAEAQDKLPGVKEYSSQKLMPFWQEKYGPIFQSCFKSVKQPDGASFAFVAAIGADGKVMRVYVDHETNVYQCLLVTLKTEQFPAPPESPYYLSIGMQFDMDTPPASKASTDGAPPLIVERNKYSYTFGVPAGWEFSLEQAYERGASLAYFPRGGSFNGSSSVIYVNVFGDECPGGCSILLSESIVETLREAKIESPRLEVTTSESILTKDGVKAAIRLVKGAKDARDPQFTDNEALAFIADDEAIIVVVLASRDPKTWAPDYSAFQQVVAGHKFFTCNSPNLASPCRK